MPEAPAPREMSREMDRTMRRGLALTVGLALAAGFLAVAPTPATAAPTESDTLVFAGYDSTRWDVARNRSIATTTGTRVSGGPVTGDFSAAPGTDVLVWGYRDRPDGIVHIEPDGAGGAITSVTPITVTGAYNALVGDYDGNGIDDVLWYGYGLAPDSLWLFRPDGSHTSRSTSVNGHYDPIVVEATGDAHDDILWYAPGSDADSLWIFGPNAGHTSRGLRIDGSYRPLVGHFRETPAGTSQEQILWSDRDGPDSMWTFTAGGHTSRLLPNVDRAQPVVGDFFGNGRDAVYWYRPGSSFEDLTTFAADGTPTLRPAPGVNGEYEPVVGDLDGDGRDDIAWTSQGTAFVWMLNWSGTGYSQYPIATGNRASVPLVVRTDPADP